MAVTDITTCYIVDQVLLAFWGLRLEIAIFALAFCAHAVLFGKYNVFASRKTKPKQPVAKDKLTGSSMPPQSSLGADAKTPLADDISRTCAGKPEAARALVRTRIAGGVVEDVQSSLVGLLQSAGRTPPVELLAAVAETAEQRSLSLNSEVGEMLLRGYYAGHLMNEFDTLLVGIEASGRSLAVGVGVQALKGDLRKGDFQASLKRLEALRHMWEGPDKSPSAAPAALLQWLARLALQQDCVPELVDNLKALGLLSETFHLLLAECAQSSKVSALSETEAIGRKEGLKFNAEAYCVLMKGAGASEEAMSLFSEAVGKVGTSKDLVVAAAGVAFSFNSSAFADDILKKLPENPPPDAAGKLLRICAGSKADMTKLLSIYMQHFAKVDLSGDVETERLIAEACIRLNRVDILRKMLATTTDSTKRVALLKQLGADGRLDDAFVVFRSFPEKGACLYNAIIDACIDNHRPEGVQEVADEAIQAGVADIVTYNTVIKAHLLAGKTAESQKTVRLMKAAGLQPNCVTFNELLDACIKHNISDAWPILDEMKACSVKPNHITCSILLKTIRANSSADNVERVLEVMDSMAEEMDEVLLSSVVEACIRAGRVDLLIPHLKRQCTSRRIQVRGPHTYGSIIRAYGFVQDIAGAWETWREMRTRQIVPTAVTVGCMVEAVVSNGDTEGGYELIQELLKDEKCKGLVNAVVYCSVLKGFSHQKKFGRFWDVYQEMLVQKVQFSIVTFNTMVDACSRCGEMSRISELLKSMVSQGIEPNLITYSAILKGYCQENRLNEAFELMKGMAQTTKFKPDEIMYNTILDGCARQGQYDRGITVLAEMEAAHITPSNFTLSVLVKLCSRSKRLDGAFQIVEDISAKYRFKPNVHVYANLIQACIQSKDLRRAFDTFEKLLDQRIRPDVRTYSLLLRACVAVGEAQDAAGLLRAAVGLRGAHPRLTNYAVNALLPQGVLPQALISEILEAIAGSACRDERLAVALLKELRTKPNVKIDPRLQMRLTTQAVGTVRRPAATRTN